MSNMKNKILMVGCLLAIVLAGCKKDNYKAPTSKITGRIVYNKTPLSVRSNGVQLELWQSGYQLFTKIPVYVTQEGTFTAEVFDGDYKLTRLKGNGPWADITDTIPVHVSGSADVEVPMDPYFIITNSSVTKSGTNINATFNIQKVNTTKGLELVKLYVGRTQLTDQNYNDGNVSKAASAITDLTQPISLSLAIPAALANSDYLFARIGVKALGVSEYLYTVPVKIALK